MALPQLTPDQFSFIDTKANIEALTGLVGGERGYATDTGEKGHYDAVGAAWVWGGGGGGAVDSVNGQTGTVVLDYSDVGADASGSAATAETNAKSYADGLVVGLWDDRGSYNASGGSYPSSGGSGTAGAILKGDIWTISVAGTLPTGQVVEVGDIVRALVDTPGNTQANWAITQNNIGYVAENTANKATTMSGNTTSNIVFLTAKAIYDWAVGLFSQIGHSHAASDIASGTMATARLGSGSASATTALHGDQTYKTVREVLTAARTYYVRTDGSDSNDGLSNTSGGAFLTIQKAVDVVAALDISIYDATIKLADGTYTLTTPILTKSPLGSGKVIIEGNTTTPANVVITSSTSSCNLIQHDNQTTVYQVKGVKFTHTGGGYSICLYAIRAKLEFTTVDFGAVSAGEHIRPANYAIIAAVGNYTISGGAARHILAATGRVEYLTANTVTLTGTPAFTQFIYVSAGSGFIANGTTTFSGSATGQRYYVDYNGVLATNGGGASYFPGNSAGSTATGGQYA